MPTVEGLLEGLNYPILSQYVTELKMTSRSKPATPESERARAVLDELRHLVTRALNPSSLPE